MQNTITQQLDEKDIECANILKRAGYGSCVAKVVVALVTGEKTQMELVTCTNKNQSDISIALKNLYKYNLINVSKAISDGEQGRPRRKYSLISWNTIIDIIEQRAIRNYEKNIEQIIRLKELTNR